MTAGKYRDVNARSLMMSRRELSRSKRRAGTIAIAALPLVMVAACSSSNSSGNSSASSGGSASPVKIGTVLPLAGELASTGLGCQAGIEAAINTVNAKGGAGGHKIELSQVNDNFEVPQTIAGAKQLAQQDGVVGIIGPAGTSAAAAIPPVADALSVPFVGPYGFTSQLYKPVHPYVFALWPGTDAATQSMTEWGIKQNKATSVAVIANNGEVGDETFAGVQAAVKAEHPGHPGGGGHHRPGGGRRPPGRVERAGLRRVRRRRRGDRESRRQGRRRCLRPCPAQHEPVVPRVEHVRGLGAGAGVAAAD
jgi:hypothetical protein